MTSCHLIFTSESQDDNGTSRKQDVIIILLSSVPWTIAQGYDKGVCFGIMYCTRRVSHRHSKGPSTGCFFALATSRDFESTRQRTKRLRWISLGMFTDSGWKVGFLPDELLNIAGKKSSVNCIYAIKVVHFTRITERTSSALWFLHLPPPPPKKIPHHQIHGVLYNMFVLPQSVRCCVCALSTMEYNYLHH